MDVRRVVLYLLGLGVILGAGYAYLVLTPQLVEITPAPDSVDIPPGTALRLQFSRPMQPDSVEEHLSFAPEAPGAFTWEGDTLVFTPTENWPAGATVNVNLAPGARTQDLVPLPLLGRRAWTFTVSSPRLVYLWPSAGQADLYALDPLNGEIARLTSSPFGVLDFSIAPGGEAIYLSQRNANGGSDIYRLNRTPGAGLDDRPTPLLACPQAICRSPRRSPDGGFVAFERQPLPGSGGALLTQVYLLTLPEDPAAVEPITGERPAGDPLHPTRSPSWSGEGLLAYYDAAEMAFILLDPSSGGNSSFANETGEPGAWSPDGTAFVAPELNFISPDSTTGLPGEEELTASYLIRFDLPTGTSQRISQNTPLLDDSAPAFSPDGERLVFARRYLDIVRWTPGRQIWMMRPDGSEAQALTDLPFTGHSAITWNPNGDQLAFVRYNQEAFTDPPELWMMDADGSDPVQLVIGGYDPQWLP